MVLYETIFEMISIFKLNIIKCFVEFKLLFQQKYIVSIKIVNFSFELDKTFDYNAPKNAYNFKVFFI